MKTKRIKVKQGFTIVELVIVIGVIGILTAILIPTFMNLTSKAQEASNQSYIKDLNTQMAIRENQTEEGGGKNNTMYDAVIDADAIGFSVEKLYPVYNRDIVWNSESNRFSLLNEDGSVYAGETDKDLKSLGTKVWKIASDKSVFDTDSDGKFVNNRFGFSIYAREGWVTADTSTQTVENLTVGFDVGKNEGFTSISYVRTDAAKGQEAVIRTNGGTLTVNAPLDTVKHYGDATVLNIEAVAPSSYHEFGTVANAQIKTGRIVIENSEAAIDNLLLIAKSDKSGFEDIVVETKTGAELPIFDRTDVNIAANGTLVFEVVTPTTDDFIYLTKAGVIEQIVVTTSEVDTTTTNVTTVESAKTASETSETTYAVAEQVANVGRKNEDGNYVDSDGNEIALENLTSENIVIAEAKADETAVQTGLTNFSGGAGTEKSPFLIASEKDWEKLAALSTAKNHDFGVAGYSYKVVNDLDMSYINLNTSKGRIKIKLAFFHGTIDFDNHTWMTSYNTTQAYDLISCSYNGCTIKNANFNLSGSPTIISSFTNDQNVVLQNINIYGNIVARNDSNYAPFCSYWMSEGSKLTMIDCNNYCNITSSAQNTGIFVGSTYGRSPSAYYYDIELKNCNNYGTLINASGNAGMLFSNANEYFDASRVKVENCGNYGTIIGKTNANLICGNLNEKYYVTTNANYDPSNNVEGLDVSNKQNGVCGKANIATLNVENGNFILPPTENAAYYVLSFVTTYNDGGGATTSIAYQLTEEQRAALDFKAYEFSVGEGSNSTTGATAITVGDGTLYVKDEKYLFISQIPLLSDRYITRQPTVSFMAFDENGNLLAAYNYTYSN